MIDLAFDSIPTTVGMTNSLNYILYMAVVISVLVMMQFAVPVGVCKQASFYSDSWPCFLI
jgi:predicted tellurium resistance membrane protein TerC